MTCRLVTTNGLLSHEVFPAYLSSASSSAHVLITLVWLTFANLGYLLSSDRNHGFL